MNRTTAAVVATWVFVIGSGAVGMASRASVPTGMCFTASPRWILAFPIPFCVLVALLTSVSPFYVPMVTPGINKRLGAGTYEKFTSALRPLLLIALSSCISALVSYFDCGESLNAGPAPFFASGAIGFLIAHMIFRFRGIPGV